MSLSIESCNLEVTGKELTAYFTKSVVQSTEPCRFCGAKPAFMEEVEVVEILVNGYLQVAKSNPFFAKAQRAVQEKELHGKPCCIDDLCEEKDLHELLGSENVLDMIGRGEYVPNPGN